MYQEMTQLEIFGMAATAHWPKLLLELEPELYQTDT
jgi:hypothetical protein